MVNGWIMTVVVGCEDEKDFADNRSISTARGWPRDTIPVIMSCWGRVSMTRFHHADHRRIELVSPQVGGTTVHVELRPIMEDACRS
jgi:hypothetical protein